jgi:hypothetical protein
MQTKHARVLTAALCFVVAAAAAACDGPSDKSNRGGGASPSAGVANSGVSDAQLDTEIARLERLAERNPGDDSMREALAQMYVRRGNNRRTAGDLRAALRDYQSAIKYDEDNEDALKNIADISPQVEGEQTGEYGEPAPLPISPGVTTGGDDDNGNSAAPSPQPAANRRRP